MTHDVKISVIIPCFNEEKYIKNTVNHVLNQDYPKDLLEIIVADGISTDSTFSILEELADHHDNIVLLKNEGKTVPFAFNKAIPKAKGEYIVILGAHSEIPENYISTLLKYSIELNADNVGGILETEAPDESSKSVAIALACSSKIGMGDSHFRVGSDKIKEVDTVPFGFYKTSVFEEIGLFDSDLTRNQDDEFNARLKNKGGKIYLIPQIKLKYFSRDSFSKVFGMFYQYGLFKPLVSKKIGRPSTLRQLVPPLFVLSIPLLLVLSLFIKASLFFLIAELIIYEMMIFITGLKYIQKRNSFSVLFSFITSIHIIHMAYGLGYLKGIWQFILLGENPLNKNLKSSR